MSAYSESAPTRAEVDALPGATIIEFGTNWCGFCAAAQAHITQALQEVRAKHPDLRHLKIEDGPGRVLGRSFKVKAVAHADLHEGRRRGCTGGPPGFPATGQ